MTPLERFLELLDGVTKSPTGWRARCPAHNDREPSLSIAEGEGGRVLVKCHAGCSLESVCSAVGLTVADLFPPASSAQPARASGPPQSRRRSSTGAFPSRTAAVQSLAKSVRGTVEGEWVYHDQAGTEAFVVVRFRTAKGKTYRPVRRTPHGWQIGDPSEPLPLYRLPELAAAARVYVTEGEKAADAARSIGLIATTSAHGAKSAHKTDWSPLAGKEVVILPDQDEAGRQYAEAVARILAGFKPAPRVWIVELPGLPEHGDVFDYLEQRDAAEPENLRADIERLATRAATLASKPPHQVLSPREPFPTDVLPEPLQSFTEAGARAIGCDPSYLALPLLAACAAAIGNTRRIQLKRGWSEPAILWTAVVGESGTLKTPAFRLAMRPLRDAQAQALQAHEESLQAHERAQLEYEKALAAWKRCKSAGIPPERPRPPDAARFIVSDTTVEALAPLLLANPRGLLMARDELAGWIGSFDRYAQGKGADSANWLSMHGGEPLIVDRKTGLPRTIYVSRAAVSVAGGIQPGVLARSLGTEHRESGLAARLLLTWPPRQVKRWTEAEIDPLLESELGELFARLLRLEPRFGDTAAFDPVVIPLSAEGKAAWIDYYDQHALAQTDLDGDLAAAWSKLEGYAARLALVVHCVRSAAGDRTDCSEEHVDAQSVAAGVELSRWFGAEARRVYNLFVESDADREVRRLVEWIERRRGRVTVREVQQGHRCYATASQARAALDGLVKAGLGYWEPVEPNGRGGRLPEVFALFRYAPLVQGESAVVS